MSKRAVNVVSPHDVIDQFGADAVRLYEMFMGPLEASKPWSTKSVEGVIRFLDRAWRLVVEESGGVSPSVTADRPATEQLRLLHQTIKKVTEDLEATARADVRVASQLDGKTIAKVVVVPGRMVNFVIKP